MMRWLPTIVAAVVFTVLGVVVTVALLSPSPSVTGKQVSKDVGDVTVQNAHYEAWNLALEESIATRLGITPAQVDAVLHQIVKSKGKSSKAPRNISDPNLQG